MCKLGTIYSLHYTNIILFISDNEFKYIAFMKNLANIFAYLHISQFIFKILLETDVFEWFLNVIVLNWKFKLILYYWNLCRLWFNIFQNY